MQPVISENWAVNWALRAREVPQGHVAAGLLIDLVADPRQVHLSHPAAFPISAAATALGVSPDLLCSALQRLSDAGLLSWSSYDAGEGDGLFAVVTLVLPGDTFHDG
ncbi:hypothetical protein OHS81_03825 [Streptomyces sp. NBC_00400]|uniref:hypothetical protein n=1 Tax=Streptomyces sp. NBC_00400 TaxID=2975737 RepID=UPI002E1CD40C